MNNPRPIDANAVLIGLDLLNRAQMLPALHSVAEEAIRIVHDEPTVTPPPGDCISRAGVLAHLKTMRYYALGSGGDARDGVVAVIKWIEQAPSLAGADAQALVTVREMLAEGVGYNRVVEEIDRALAAEPGGGEHDA